MQVTNSAGGNIVNPARLELEGLAYSSVASSRQENLLNPGSRVMSRWTTLHALANANARTTHGQCNAEVRAHNAAIAATTL